MIIFTNGCFDIIHRGHIELLRYCQNQGKKVIVGLNSDKSISRLKGADRPINNQADRKLILESLIYVDEVVIFEEDTPYNLIKCINPDIIVKGGDYTVKEVVGNDIAHVKIFEFVDGYSTSKTIKNISDR
tara:strand:- start:891 stop:1280 length:390 start_codon:yes stop_codon:yes gene_type:complete